jgi:uncharacterized protein
MNRIEQLKQRELPINYRTLAIDKSGKLTGLAERVVSGYGVIWSSVNDYREQFVKGAFTQSIEQNGPNSQSAYKIKLRDRHGKAVALMAELTQDEIGLKFKSAPLDNVQWADDLLTQIESGTINNFSIGFKYDWGAVEIDDNDNMIIKNARLFEISAVDVPSDTGTFAIRSMEPVGLPEVEEFIKSLPKANRLEARVIITRAMQSGKPISISDSKPTKKELNLNYLLKNFK